MEGRAHAGGDVVKQELGSLLGANLRCAVVGQARCSCVLMCSWLACAV